MYPPCEPEKNHNIKRRENKQPRLKNKWIPPNQGNPLAPRGRPAVWPADRSPAVWSLVEVITIKQITISFLSPTMSEPKTSGPRPKIPSPQAPPAPDQADTAIEGKGGTASACKPRSFSHFHHRAVAHASFYHRLHPPYLFLFFPSPNNERAHVSVSLSTSAG